MYDIIIVGSGISGSTIAKSLEGFKVLILEKNKKVAPKDSGIVSKRFLEHYDSRFIRHEIDEIELVSPGGKSFFLRNETPFAYILHRERLARFLIKNSKKSADFRNETFISMKIEKEKAVVTTNNGDYEAKVVVGCDGAFSNVRKCIGIPQMKLSVGVMVKGSGIRKGNIRTFFNKNYSPDFFSWIIPQSDEYGLMAGSGSNECLEKFRSDHALKEGKTYAYMIPTGMVRSYSDRCILVGDTCGQNKPLTGGGIIFSLTGAKHAVACLDASFKQNRFDRKFLSYYEKSWKKEISFEIRKQIIARRAYSKMSNDDIEKIFHDFGSHLQKLRDFDYDNFSRSWVQMPKIKLLRFALSNIRSIF